LEASRTLASQGKFLLGEYLEFEKIRR